MLFLSSLCKCKYNSSEKAIAYEPSKTVKRRKRALTLPLPTGSNSSKKQKTLNQDQCLLLSRLPAEIRTQIWKECIGDLIVTLTEEKSCLRQFDLPFDVNEGHRRGFLSLLLCCRRMCIYPHSIISNLPHQRASGPSIWYTNSL